MRKGETQMQRYMNGTAAEKLPQIAPSYNTGTLLTLLYQGKPLAQILHEASRMLCNPLFLDDDAFCPLCRASARPLSAQQLRRIGQYDTEEFYQVSCRENAQERRLYEPQKAVYYLADGTRPASVLCAIPVRADRYVFLSVYEIHAPFSSEIETQLHELSCLAAWLLRQEPPAPQAESPEDAALKSLLSGKPLTASEKAAAQALEQAMPGEKRLVLIRFPSSCRDRLFVRWILSRLQAQLQNARLWLFEENMLCLLSGEAAFSQLSQIEQYLPTDQLTAGCSNAFPGFNDLPQAYRQADTALRLGARLKKADVLFQYADLAGYQLCEACLRAHDAEVYCHPSLLNILTYDREHGTNYAGILYAYLKNSSHQGHTANALDICRGTLAYHLERLRERFGVDTGDAQSNFRFLLSYQLLELSQELSLHMTEK